jgi:hypothetical protein
MSLAIDPRLRRMQVEGDAADRWYAQGERQLAEGRENLAIRSLREALLCRADHQEAGLMLASILHQQWNDGRGGQDELAESASLLGRFAHETPDWLSVRALQCRMLHRHRDALKLLARAVQLDPDNHLLAFELASQRWLSGDIAGSFPGINRRLEMPERGARLVPGVPLWDGRPLEGRLLLNSLCEGMGDSLLGAQLIALARLRVGGMSLLCYPGLERLMGRMPEIDRIYPEGTDPDPGDYQAQIPVMSLVGALRITESRIPGRPCLSADQDTIEHWRPRLAGIRGFKAGIAWQGNPDYSMDRRRSFPLAEVAPVAAVPGISLVSLQHGRGAEQIAGAPFPIFDLGPDFQAGDLLDTAAILRQLDLVIACDSCVAHLAGCLGVPVWVALYDPPNFRWQLERESSTWFPSARLFRQRAPHGWDAVFERMAAAIQHA